MNSQYNNPNMDEMINYLEDVLEVAKKLNPNYYDYLEKDLLLSKSNYSEWESAKKIVLAKIDKRIFPTKLLYKEDSPIIIRYITNILKYAKELNPKLRSFLITDLSDQSKNYFGREWINPKISAIYDSLLADRYGDFFVSSMSQDSKRRLI